MHIYPSKKCLIMANYTNTTCLSVIEGVKKEQIVKDLKKHAANQNHVNCKPYVH